MKKSHQFIRIGGLIILLVVVALILSYMKNENREVPDIDTKDEETDEEIVEELEMYRSTTLNFEFLYRTAPDGYTLVEHPDPEDVALLSLVLVDSDEYEELLDDPNPREAPPTITLQVYDWTEYQDPLAWIVQSGRSNIVGEPEVEEQGDITIYSYRTDGLYAGKSRAYTYSKNDLWSNYIYVWNSGYLTEDDQILSDFDSLLATFHFDSGRR